MDIFDEDITFEKQKTYVTLDNFANADGPIDSPRSLEACLRTGIDPAELIPKSLTEFVKNNEFREVAVMLHEHFEHRRQEKLATARKERNMIIEFLEKAEAAAAGLASPGDTAAKGASPNGVASPTATQKLASSPKMHNSGPPGLSIGGGEQDVEAKMLAKEAKRLELLKERQRREIEQIVAYEIEMAKMQDQARAVSCIHPVD